MPGQFVAKSFVNHGESFPGQESLEPRPGQPFRQQEHKQQHGQNRTQRQLEKRHGKGQEEDRFDVENQEQDAVEVVARTELGERIPRVSMPHS